MVFYSFGKFEAPQLLSTSSSNSNIEGLRIIAAVAKPRSTPSIPAAQPIQSKPEISINMNLLQLEAHSEIPINIWHILTSPSLCSLCSTDLESQDHLFLGCHKVISIWEKLFHWWTLPFTLPNSTDDLLHQCQFATSSPGINKIFHQLCICCLWAIWYARKMILFSTILNGSRTRFSILSSRDPSFGWIRAKSPEIIFTPSDLFQFPLEVATYFN